LNQKVTHLAKLAGVEPITHDLMVTYHQQQQPVVMLDHGQKVKASKWNLLH
jgi:hypothetical protein